MKAYSYKDAPIKVFGVIDFEKKQKIQRLSDELIEKIPRLSHLGRRCPGARIGFKTDSENIKVKITFETLSLDVGMSIYSCQSAAVFAGERQKSRFLGLVNPANYEQKIFEKTLKKGKTLEDVTVWLPRNEIVADVEISVDDGAQMLPPTPYKYSKPILYYGSSITEGGCCESIHNGYNAIISRHLDVDYYNLGFSGNARGDMNTAEFIAGVDMSIFVYDYDHNAPTVEHLANTHEPFFKYIRERNPELPVVMMTRPAITYSDDHKARREVVRRTYENAIKAGDKNVYFIDGETFFGDSDRELCTVDRIHPNDLGFARMAAVVEPVIKSILEKI